LTVLTRRYGKIVHVFGPFDGEKKFVPNKKEGSVQSTRPIGRLKEVLSEKPLARVAVRIQEEKSGGKIHWGKSCVFVLIFKQLE
jgi:hypothetical protein